MAARPKYMAVLPDGRTVTRQTKRTYTHVVVCRGEGHDWGVWGWAGRYDLAWKAHNQARQVWPDVQIVPAVPTDCPHCAPDEACAEHQEEA